MFPEQGKEALVSLCVSCRFSSPTPGGCGSWKGRGAGLGLSAESTPESADQTLRCAGRSGVTLPLSLTTTAQGCERSTAPRQSLTFLRFFQQNRISMSLPTGARSHSVCTSKGNAGCDVSVCRQFARPTADIVYRSRGRPIRLWLRQRRRGGRRVRESHPRQREDAKTRKWRQHK